MDQLEKYTNIINNINCIDLYLMPHKSVGAYPTGIDIIKGQWLILKIYCIP